MRLDTNILCSRVCISWCLLKDFLLGVWVGRGVFGVCLTRLDQCALIGELVLVAYEPELTSVRL